MPRKPYVLIYRPLSIRLEQPPSPTPSPTEYISSMRLEYGGAPHSRSNSPDTTTSGVAASAHDGNSATHSDSQLPYFKAPPGKAFDAAEFDAAGGVKIVRPPGPLAKPSSGGYTLRDVLYRHGWNPVEYNRVQIVLHEVASKHLDVEKPFMKQADRAIRRYVDTALERFPGLEYYVDEWPARDFATMYCKNKTAEAVKKAAQAQEASTSARSASAST